MRSYEVDYVAGLWHLDFHHGSHKVLTPAGRWVRPLLLGIIDDHSRLIRHLQWYLDETAKSLVHGFCQALQRRGLPRALMTDNGAAMQAEEFRSGLHTLGILHETTLPYSPYHIIMSPSHLCAADARNPSSFRTRAISTAHNFWPHTVGSPHSKECPLCWIRFT